MDAKAGRGPLINSFWHGDTLSTLERLCIASFLHNGFAYHLYVYDEPAGVPAGVSLEDANALVPRELIFRYTAGDFNLGSVAGFSNLFRYTLLHRIGGWWADTDHCCLQPSARDGGAEVFIQEQTLNGDFRVASAFMKAAAGSPLLRYCLDRIAQKDLAKVIHGELGPDLMTAAAREQRARVIPPARFFPVPWWDYERLLYDEQFSIEEAVTVHFWNAMLTSAGVDKDAQFPAASIFEKLKQRYL